MKKNLDRPTEPTYHQATGCPALLEHYFRGRGLSKRTAAGKVTVSGAIGNAISGTEGGGRYV